MKDIVLYFSSYTKYMKYTVFDPGFVLCVFVAIIERRDNG